MKLKKLDHVVLYTTDSKASIQFYKMLGFTVRDAVDRYELTAGDFSIHVFEKGKCPSTQCEKAMPGTVDICLELDNGLSMLKTYLQEQGVQVVEGIVPRSGVKGSMQSIYLKDPDGNVIEICCYND